MAKFVDKISNSKCLSSMGYRDRQNEQKMINLLSLPDEILDTVISYTTYDEVSRLRMVCKKFDAASQRVLNQGFYKVEKYHAQCLRKVKEQLPRRESERRKHPLSVHCDILTSIETRLSLLGMTFMKYVELKYCCFIPGKVLDEIFKILRYVSSVTVPPRAHDILLELRDISSMAMEHFDEKIAPVYRTRCNSSPKLSVTTYGAFTGTSRCSNNSNQPAPRAAASNCRIESSRCCSNRQCNYRYSDVKRENADLKRKLAETRRKVTELDRRLVDQNNINAQKNNRLVEVERKQTEQTKELSDMKKSISELTSAFLKGDTTGLQLDDSVAITVDTLFNANTVSNIDEMHIKCDDSSVEKSESKRNSDTTASQNKSGKSKRRRDNDDTESDNKVKSCPTAANRSTKRRKIHVTSIAKNKAKR